MESALLKAKSEMDVAKGRAQELEALILKKDQVISEQKALHNQILVFQYFMSTNNLNQQKGLSQQNSSITSIVTL